MRWSEGVPAMAIATVLAVGPGCGARTGFLTDEGGDGGTLGEQGSGDDGSGPSGGGGGSGVYCTFHHGPVASCASAPGDLVMLCDLVCLNVDGQWGCCTSHGPNNGSGGSCGFPELWKCSPDGGLTSALP
jgi:hypothetical protein